MDVEIFETEGGYGFLVAGVFQPWHPEKEGNVPMTRDEAETYGAAVLARLQVG